MAKPNLVASTEPKLNSTLEKVLERGIPVWHAEFLSAVNNSDNVPENFFSSQSHVKSRQVEMWWINGDGLICKHQNKWFIVPTGNIKFVRFS